MTERENEIFNDLYTAAIENTLDRDYVFDLVEEEFSESIVPLINITCLLSVLYNQNKAHLLSAESALSYKEDIIDNLSDKLAKISNIIFDEEDCEECDCSEDCCNCLKDDELVEE